MQDRQPPKKHALNNPKIRLSAPNPQCKGVYANLSWDIYQNNPRIVVDTKDPQFKNPENNYGRIQAAMDPVILSMFMENLAWAIELQTTDKRRISNYGNDRSGPRYEPGKPPPPPVHLTDVWVGRDADMNVFISVVNQKENWPKIKFLFDVPDRRFVKFYKGDGTELNKGEVSTLAAKAYLRLLSNLMPAVLANTYEHVMPAQFAGRGGNGGGRSGGGSYGGGKPANGGGNYTSNAPASGGDDTDSDIPF